MNEPAQKSEQHFIVSSSPHIRTDESIPRIMFGVVAALIPALIGAVYFYGLTALWITTLSVTVCIATEALIQRFRNTPITISDGSAIVTGILFAYNLPPGIPWWIAVIGAVFSIGIGKHTFGGLGFNPMNPALLGRAFLLLSWPVHMTKDWMAPAGGTMSGLAAVTSSTPLAAVKGALHQIEAGAGSETARNILDSTHEMYSSLFWGRVGGCIGETSVFLLLIGALYLLYRGYITYRIPVAYLGSAALMAWVFSGEELFTGDVLFHMMAGGMVLGAFFMATDMVTSPSSPLGQWIFGIGGGIIAIVIRIWGGYPEGVSYSILLMNIVTPLLDRLTMPKVFGAR